MYDLNQVVSGYAAQYKKIKEDPAFAKKNLMTEDTYFIGENDVLALPRTEGDSRYAYLRDGFNFWTYASGYMHANEGLFSTFITVSEGKEPKVAFFAGLPKEGGADSAGDAYDVVSLMSVPHVRTSPHLKVERYTVMTSSCTYYITELPEIRFAVRVFATFDKKMYFTVTAQNLTDKPVKYFISNYFNPFLRHSLFEDFENRFYRTTEYIEPTAKQNDFGSFLFTVNEHMSRTLMLFNYSVLNRSCEMSAGSNITSTDVNVSRHGYIGETIGSIANPAPLFRGEIGKKSKKSSVIEVTVAADLVHMELEVHGTMRCDMRLVNTEDTAQKDALLGAAIRACDVDAELATLIATDRKKNENIKMSFGETVEGIVKNNILSSFTEHVKRQVELYSMHNGYLQLWDFSMIGIRDICQATEALLYWQPDATKRRMVEALGFTDTSGRCPRQYSLPINDSALPKMDLRPFIDQGVWVMSTIVAYLKFTGDFSILDEMCGYYDVVDEDKHLVKKVDLKETVLEHMLRIMNYLEENRDHGATECLRILYGDWNDALDGLGVTEDPGKDYGTGVSVMASLQYYQNLNDMAELLSRLDATKYAKQIASYQKSAAILKEGLRKYAVVENEKGEKRVLHGWGDKKSYDIGSFKDPDGVDRIGLVAHAYWVISELLDSTPEMKDAIVSNLKALDSQYGVKTFSEGFAVDSPGVGRIRNLPKGTYENGASYNHATCFGIWALLRMGESKFAWEQISKAVPFTHEKTNISPFVMPNSYFSNTDYDLFGQSVMDWQTGSSTVLTKAVIRYVFGVQPEYDGFYIAPAAYLPFAGSELYIKIGDCDVTIVRNNRNAGQHGQARVFKVNGAVVAPEVDAVSGTDKIWLDRSVFDVDAVRIEIEG